MLANFFSLIPGKLHFKLFGFWHIIISLVMIIAIILIIVNKERLKSWCIKHEKLLRYTIASIMFLNMTIYYLSKVIDGTWNYKVHLPLHFCFISGYLFMFSLFTNNKKLFKTIFFFSFAGPLPAIILPDLVCGPDRFIFWQFVISHHFYLISNIFCLYVLDWKIEKPNILKVLLKANLVFLAVFVFNQIFHTNYIMTTKLPDHIIKLMPIVTKFNHPIIWLELAGLVAFSIGYLFVYFHNKYEISE